MTSRGHSSVKDTAVLSLLTVCSSGFSFLVTFLLAHFWGPEVYGQWQVLMTILFYLTLFDLGIYVGITREIPYLLGIGDETSYGKTAGTVFAWSFFLTVLMFGGLAVGGMINESSYLRWGLPLLGAYMLIYCFSNYFQVMLYAHQGLRLWGFATFTRSLIRLFMAVLLVQWGVEVMLAGWTVGELVPLIMIRRENRSIRIHWAFDFRIFKRLFFLGFPLFLLTIVEWQTRVGDRAIVALMLGEGVLGYYGLASTFSAALTMIAIQVSQTMQPRIYRRYGETHDVNALKEQVLEPCRAVSRVFPFGIGLAVLGIPLFIRIFLPAYEPAIPIAVGLCLASFFLAVPQTQAALLMALEKQWLNLGIWSVVLAINLGLNFYLLSRGWGMTGVALGTGTSWVICFLLRYAVTLPYHLNWAESVRYVSVLLLPFLYMLIVIGIGKVIFQGEGFAVDAGEILLFLLAYSPILWWANKKYAVWVSLRDYFRTWKERAA